MTNFEESKAYRIAERIIKKNYAKYNEEEHIRLILKLFEDGKDISQFCAAAEISRITFFDWISKYPNFAMAFDTAKELARDYHEKVAMDNRDNPTFNNGLWLLIARNRFDYTTERKLKISKFKKAKTSAEEFKVLKEEVSMGNFTPAECEKMARFVAIGAEINIKTELENRLTKIEEQHKERL